ncbi:prolyl oligopeptidase family serine peptidase [Aliidiomarina taiwanensis]|nr:S9 family peptidase [Aliidiomarina taiwanensis]
MLKRVFTLTLVGSMLAAPALAWQEPTPSAITSTKFVSEDIFDLEFASNPEISPNGQWVVYTRNSFDIMHDNTKRSLWLLNTKTGEHTPLFADQASYGNATWSPDSSRLAFTSNRDGKNQIHVHYLAQNRTAAVTSVTSSPRELSWSHDGKHIAFMMNVPAAKTPFAAAVYTPSKPAGAEWAPKANIVERTYYQRDGAGILADEYAQVFVVPSEGGTARQLTEGAFSHNGPLVWLADNQSLVFSGNRSEDWEYQTSEADLWQVDVNTTALTQLTDLPGREYSATLSHNGRQLAFLYRTDAKVPYQNTKLRILDLRTQEQKELLSDFDRSVENPQWINNRSLAIQYEDRGLVKLAEVSTRNRLKTGVEDLGGVYVSRPYTSGSYSLARDTGQVAYTQASSYRPADVAILSSVTSTRPETLTQLNEDVLSQRELGQVHEITYTSNYDDTEVHGWYITPPNFDPTKKYPLMLEIHGGPHLAYSAMFAAEHQRYAAEGYVVFYNNYRGSTSYGAEHAMKLDGFYSSERDFGDHMGGIDALIEKGFVDEQNLFIAGGSAGGIATTYAVGLTDRFNAAAATNPVINWISKTLTADSYLGQIANQFPGMPWEHYEHYWKRSSLSLVGNVTTPVMLFSGEQDRRVPMSEIEQFYQALQLQKVDTAMVRVPEAPHGVTSRPSNMISKIEHTLAWFKLYMKD